MTYAVDASRTGTKCHSRGLSRVPFVLDLSSAAPATPFGPLAVDSPSRPPTARAFAANRVWFADAPEEMPRDGPDRMSPFLFLFAAGNVLHVGAPTSARRSGSCTEWREDSSPLPDFSSQPVSCMAWQSRRVEPCVEGTRAARRIRSWIEREKARDRHSAAVRAAPRGE